MNQIKHLYWRAGFGMSPEEWRRRRDWPVDRAVDELFETAARAQPLAGIASPTDDNTVPVDRADLQERLKEERQLVGRHNVDWIGRMGNPTHAALLERMSLFWHGHFACRSLIGKLAQGQLDVLRTHGLGKFRDLVLAVARDPSMIRYLNNQQNRKEQPNENFARELMELFTIGRGNYTEQDIKEAARAFTGWSSTLRGEFVFRAFQHDYGKKNFFGKSGFYNGDDIIDLILERKETAHFLVTKIYRYFVNEQVDEAVVRELAEQFYTSDYDIGRLMRRIFTSDWFYRPENVGAKIKAPVELMAGMIRSLGLTLQPATALLPVQKALGQMLFNPPNVAGWPGGKSWIDNSTLLLRLNLPSHLMNADEVPFRPKTALEDQEAEGRIGRLQASFDWNSLAGLLPNDRPAAMAEVLSDFLLCAPSPVEPGLWDRLAEGKTDEELLKRIAGGVMALPEYQMC